MHARHAFSCTVISEVVLLAVQVYRDVRGAQHTAPVRGTLHVRLERLRAYRLKSMHTSGREIFLLTIY